jgi:hypothetical protein
MINKVKQVVNFITSIIKEEKKKQNHNFCRRKMMRRCGEDEKRGSVDSANGMTCAGC